MLMDMTTIRSSRAAQDQPTSAVTREVGVRDLKARLSEYLRAVKGGATIVVTEHGRPVARLVPDVSPSMRERILALAQAGLIVWNGERYAPVKPRLRLRGARTLADLVVEERDRT